MATATRTDLYVNNAALITESDLTNTAPGNSVNYFSLGVDDSIGSSVLNVYFDDAAVADSYIGPEPSPPTPSPTPTLNPSPTPTDTPTPSPIGPNQTIYTTFSLNMTATVPEPQFLETNLTMQIQDSWIANDGTVYAGSNQILYKSLDGGVTWQPLITFNGTDVGVSVYVSSLNYVFAAPSTSAFTSELGLWRSTNAGQTWSTRSASTYRLHYPVYRSRYLWKPVRRHLHHN